MFDFPSVPHKIYHRNFLRSTLFSIEFSEEIQWELHSDAIAAMFSDEYPTKTPRLNIGINFTQKSAPKVSTHANAFELNGLNGLKSLAFEGNILTILFHGESYKSFSSIEPFFNRITELLQSELSKYRIQRFSERKINLIDFKIRDNEGLTMLRQLITSSLIGNIDYVPNLTYINQSINSISFEKPDTRLNIKYGYNKINASISQIILDLTITTENNKKESSIIEYFETINSELYKAFNWAITEDYKKLMNHE